MVAACPFPARRGTPLRIERIADSLVQRGHHVEVFAYDLAESNYPHPYTIHRPSGKPEVGTIPPGPKLRKLLRYDPALACLLRNLLRGNSFDVIHAHHFEGLLVSRWARRHTNTPLVYDAHTMLHSELPSYSQHVPRSIVRTLGGWLDWSLPKLADHIITVTPDIRDRLHQRFGLPADRITVAMNGVELDRFPQSHALPMSPGRVVYCGTLARYQGIDLLLQSFALARKREPSLELVVVSGESFESYEALARDLGVRSSIRLERDSLEELPRRLMESAIAVLPRPVCDGIPQKLLNYMAAGRPVVSFEGSAKILVHEQTGLIVEGASVESFADALVRLAQNPPLARKLGEEARRFVEANCTWDRAASQCEAVYRSLLPGDS
jgi:glycosyltransferase involved in cell wall biosynthesis